METLKNLLSKIDDDTQEEILQTLNERLDNIPELSPEEYEKEYQKLLNLSEEEVLEMLQSMVKVVPKPQHQSLFKDIDPDGPCMCGSGKSFKDCCMNEFLEYVSQVTPDALDSIKTQMIASNSIKE